MPGTQWAAQGAQGQKKGHPAQSSRLRVMSDSLQPHRLYSPWNSPGQNTGMGSLSLLQGIFPTQGSNPGVLHCRRVLYQLSHKGSPLKGVHLSKPGFLSLGAVDIRGQVTLCDPCTVQSMEFSRQKYWSGLPCLSPGNLPDPGIKPRSPALQADSLLSEPWVSQVIYVYCGSTS